MEALLNIFKPFSYLCKYTAKATHFYMASVHYIISYTYYYVFFIAYPRIVRGSQYQGPFLGLHTSKSWALQPQVLTEYTHLLIGMLLCHHSSPPHSPALIYIISSPGFLVTEFSVPLTQIIQWLFFFDNIPRFVLTGLFLWGPPQTFSDRISKGKIQEALVD